MRFEAALCILALLVSGVALLVAFLARRHARNMGFLSNRLRAINDVRGALYEAAIRGGVRHATTTSLGNACQLASTVFSKILRQALDEGHKLPLDINNLRPAQQ